LDSKILLLNDWTTNRERMNSRRVRIEKIEKNDDKKTIVGILAKGSGEGYNPTINWETGEVSCGCGRAAQSNLLFCSHLIALFDTLCSKKRTEKYAEMFIKALQSNSEYTSYKSQSGPIPTGCNKIDGLLGGGFKRGVITAVVGPTKVGKSFLATQTAVYNIILGRKVLYIDTEGYYRDKDVYPKFVKYFRTRWYDIAGDKPLNMNFLFPRSVEDFASYLGLAITLRSVGGKLTPVIYSNVPRGDKSPIYGIVADKKIDLIIVDSFTAMFKKGVVTSQSQARPGRGDLINAIYARLEEVANDLNVAVLLVNHASRNYDFNVNDLLTGKLENGSGVWGGYSFMFNVKYLVQIEYVPMDTKEDRDRFKGRMARYVIRRLWPAMYPQYVIVEILKDYGYEDFDPSKRPVDMSVEERERLLSEMLEAEG